MQARHLTRLTPASQARLQLVLILLAAWDFVTFLLELGNNWLLRIDGIDGALGGRSMSGAVAVLAIAYLYAARNPVRYRFILWLATLEQFIALFAATFHWARGDVGAAEVTIPILIAAGFLMLLLANLPRQTDAL